MSAWKNNIRGFQPFYRAFSFAEPQYPCPNSAPFPPHPNVQPLQLLISQTSSRSSNPVILPAQASKHPKIHSSTLLVLKKTRSRHPLKPSRPAIQLGQTSQASIPETHPSPDLLTITFHHPTINSTRYYPSSHSLHHPPPLLEFPPLQAIRSNSPTFVAAIYPSDNLASTPFHHFPLNSTHYYPVLPFPHPSHPYVTLPQKSKNLRLSPIKVPRRELGRDESSSDSLGRTPSGNAR